jgi:(heptosyl)LPS beta-1,4-glucosyltransferase
MTWPVSVVILSRNEAERIGRSIDSVSAWAGDLILIDSYSSDQTLSIVANKWTAAGRSPRDLKIYSQEWKGFLETRNQSRLMVSQPWVLWLDADEWVSQSLKQSLETFFKTTHAQSVFKIARQSEFLGRPIRHGGWYPDLKARLARSGACEWRAGPRGADVHEDLFATSQPSERPRIDGVIGHLPFRSTTEQFETNRRYADLLGRALATEYKKKGRRSPTLPFVYLKVVIKFLENYIFKLGFLDGWPGFLIAKGSAQSLRMRYQVVREALKS